MKSVLTSTIPVAALTGLLCGLLGGWIGASTGRPDHKALTVDQLTVNRELLVRSGEDDIVVRVSDGSLVVSRALVAGEIRTHQASASSFVTSTNPTAAIGQQRIAAELAATENGGSLFLRNDDGATLQGADPAGYALCMGYNASGEPLIYGLDHTTSPPVVHIEFAPKTRVATQPPSPGPMMR